MKLILLLLCINIVNGFLASNDCNNDDPLNCYLNSLIINLPDFCDTIIDTEFCITNFICSNININSLPSQYITPTSLHLDIDNLNIICEGDYKYGLISGTATGTITNVNSNLELLINKVGEYPNSAQLTVCEVPSIDVDVDLSGLVVDIISPILENLIIEFAQKKLCDLAKDFVADDISQWLANTTTPHMEEIISSQPSEPHQFDRHFMVWGDSVVSKIRSLVDRIGGLSGLLETVQCLLGDSMFSAEYFSSYEKTVVYPTEGNISPTRKEGTKSNVFQSDKLSNIESMIEIEQSIDSTDTRSEVPKSSNKEEQSVRSAFFDMLRSTSILNSGEIKIPLGLPLIDASWELPDFPPGYTTTLSLDAIRFRGLDSLNEIALLEPVSYNNYTIHNAIGFSSLSVTTEMTIQIANDAADSDDKYTEHIEISLSNMNTTFVLDGVLAVNEYVLKSLFLDQLSSPNCWFNLIDEASISNLQLRFSNITEVGVTQLRGDAGELENDVADLLNNVVALMTSEEGFGKLTADLINGLMQGYVRSLINEDLRHYIEDGRLKQPCLTHYPYDDSNEFVPWVNSSLIYYFDLLVNELVGADGVNQVLSCATNGTGSVYINTNYLTIGLGGLNSFYELELLEPAKTSEITFSSETSSNDINYDLLSSLGVGYCPDPSSLDCNPLILNIQFNEANTGKIRRVLSSSDAGDAIKEALSQLDLTLSFTNFSLFLDTYVKVDRNAMRDTKYGNIGVTGCLATSVNDLIVENLALGVSTATLNWAKGDVDITDVTESLFGFIGDPDRLASKNKDISKSLASSGDTCANGGINPNAEDSTYKKNDDDDDGDSVDWKWQLFFVVVGCVTALLALAYAYRFWGTAKKFLSVPALIGHHSPLTSDEEDHQRLLELRRTNQSGILTELWYGLNCKNALVFHHNVPIWLRILFPIAILGNMACFLNSNIDKEAVSVMLSITIGDTTEDMGSIFDFGLKSTVWDMWDAKVYALAVLIFFFSGMWPYIKLFTMLVCWLTPPVLLPITYRETILVVLDALGKWSLIDFYVMVLMLCAFYYNIYIGDGIEVNVTVKPKFGFYGFLLATMVSLGLGHIVLACHRLIVERKMLPIPESISPKESLSSFIYQINIIDSDNEEFEDSNERKIENIDVTVTVNSNNSDNNSTSEGADSNPSMSESFGASASEHSAETVNPVEEDPNISSEISTSERQTVVINDLPHDSTQEREIAEDNQTENSTEIVKCRRTSQASSLNNPPKGTAMLVELTPFGIIFIIVTIFVTAMFAIAGTFMITMTFDFQGLVGALLKDESTVSYSYVDVGNEIPEHSGVPGDFAVRWMQASFFVFGQAMPFSLLLLLLVIFVVPMSLVWQKTIMVVCEVFNAWASLDVFCVAIAAALLEIEQFAKFIVGDSCDEVDKVLEEYADDLLDGNDTCFDVKAELTSDSWVIFTAAALLIIVGTPLLGMAHSAVKLRQSRIEHAIRLLQMNPSKYIHLHPHVTDKISKNGKLSIDKEEEEDFSNLIEPLLTNEDNINNNNNNNSIRSTLVQDYTQDSSNNNDTAATSTTFDKKSLYSMLTYQNFIILCVKLAEICSIVRITTMSIAEANYQQAELLLFQKHHNIFKISWPLNSNLNKDNNKYNNNNTYINNSNSKRNNSISHDIARH